MADDMNFINGSMALDSLINLYATLNASLREKYATLGDLYETLTSLKKEMESFDINNFDVPYQRMSDKIIDTHEYAKNTLNLVDKGLNALASQFNSYYSSQVKNSLMLILNGIALVKEKGVTVDPTLSVDPEQVGCKMFKLDQINCVSEHNYEKLVLDERKMYGVNEIIQWMAENFSCYGIFSFFNDALNGYTLKNVHGSAFSTGETADKVKNIINEIIGNMADPVVAWNKIKEDSSNKLGYTIYLVDTAIKVLRECIALSDNISKTYKIFKDAYQKYTNPENIVHTIL